ncbi:hypothetical protein, partial [Ferrimonas sediminum]|uniref:hypothetical protein n=1 Tax=Ferrimonas sediminum TaxID=718193 RepID=UPI001C40A881
NPRQALFSKAFPSVELLLSALLSKPLCPVDRECIIGSGFGFARDNLEKTSTRTKNGHKARFYTVFVRLPAASADET